MQVLLVQNKNNKKRAFCWLEIAKSMTRLQTLLQKIEEGTLFSKI